MALPTNHIEFRDYNPEGPMHVAGTVLIDGNEVLVEEGGVAVDFSDFEPTTVTLRLLPHRVSFN